MKKQITFLPAIIMSLLFLFAISSRSASEGDVSDSDNDGLPDAWEKAHGCDPNDPSDADLDYDLDGYSNMEEFKAGTDPGQDLVGYKALGKSTPLWKWSNEEVLDVLDRFAQNPGEKFAEIVQYRQALVPALQNEAFKRALDSTYDSGKTALKENKDLPQGFLAALRIRAEKEKTDLSELMVFTNVAVQRVVLSSLMRRTATPSEINSLIKRVEGMDQQNKNTAISVLLKSEAPDAKAFLDHVQDPCISNRVRAVLLKRQEESRAQEPMP